jgi:hypothetical protein
MGKPIVLLGLIRKRAELAGKLLDIQAQIADVDRVLAIFAYEGDPADIRPKRSSPRLFKRMELTRLIHAAGTDGEKRSSREMAVRLMTAKGLDVSDRRLVAKVVQSVRKQRGRARRRLAVEPTVFSGTGR